MTIVRALVFMGVGAILTTTVLGEAGCHKKSRCEKLYEKIRVCTKRNVLPKAKFMPVCRELEKQPLAKDQVACADKPDCEAFKDCYEHLLPVETQMLGNVMSIDVFLKMGDHPLWTRELAEACAYQYGYLPVSYQKKCEKFARELIAKYQSSMPTEPSMKEKRSYVRDHRWVMSGLCNASKMAPFRKDACSARQNGYMVSEVMDALQEAEKEVKDKSTVVPWRCIHQSEKLRKAGLSDKWRRDMHQRLTALCYGQIGKNILQEAAAERFRRGFRPACGERIQDAYRGVRRFHIQDKEIEAAVSKLRKRRCKKEFAAIDAELSKASEAAGGKQARQAR